MRPDSTCLRWVDWDSRWLIVAHVGYARLFGYQHVGTRNQEIFGQKLADYAVDCLWILVIVIQ